MKNIKQKTTTLMLVLALCLTVSIAYPQIGIPGGGGIDNVGDEAPIASLVLLGLAAGAVFGIKTLRSKD